MKTQPSGESIQSLSGALSDPIPNIRQHFAPWFEAATAFNELGTRVLSAIEPAIEDRQQIFAALLYCRTLTSFQAAHLLAGHGMPADARTLVRAGAETAIVLCAVARDKAVIDKLVKRGA